METVTDTTTVETVTKHESSHHKLIEEIAERVEERLVAKAAKWLIFNFLAIVAAVSAGVAAYYNLDARLSNTKVQTEQQEQLLNLMRHQHTDDRAFLEQKLEGMNTKIDEINRFLRDHNTQTMNRLK